MKKIMTLVLALMMLMLAACGGNADQTTVADNAAGEAGYKNDVAVSAIRDAVAAVYGEGYLASMALDAEMLEMSYGITADMYEEFVAEVPMMSAHVDTLIVVKAKADKVETVKAALEAYQNQGPFNYDPNLDPMYQQHRNRLMTQGKQAMEDTLGMIQARTGGYGNSYAQTAGQQTYQGYMQELTDLMPQLYELAYGKYTDETDRLKENYQMYEDAKTREKQDHEKAVRDHEEQVQNKYDEYMDQRKHEDAEFEKLVDLILLGYIPTNEEMAAVGMTPGMLAALLNKRK
jgi:hypothetical protein